MTPDQYTIQESFLDVGDSHQLYVHDWGSPTAGLPIVFLHGGPGTGTSDRYKTSFDPRQQRIIFFDQRGAGRSLPQGSMEHNTTTDLVQDIEKIADHLALKRFILTGGSWGSCLALAYGLKHPQRLAAVVLRGIFTGSRAEIEWLTEGRFRDFFPDVWQEYLDATPASQAANPFKYHAARILGDDPQAAKESAYLVGKVEGAVLKLDDRFTPDKLEDYDPTFIKFETYYMQHDCFLEEPILRQAHKLKVPVWLIQGRYDMVCPPITAWQLHQQLPNSELIWTVAGHGNDRSNHDVYRTLLLQLTKAGQ